MITKTQIRVLSAVYYLIQKRDKPVILAHHIKKQLTDLKQGTLSSTLQCLEHKMGLVISMPTDAVLRSLYANPKSPGTTRKYYITKSGKKLINMYLNIIKRDGKSVDYEKLSAAAYATIRTPERRFTQSF